MKLLNLKLTLGDRSGLTPNDIWAELGKLFLRRATGELKAVPPVHSGRPPVDVREWVKGL